MIGNISIQEIDAKRAKIDALSRKIWQNPEAGYREHLACEAVSQLLKEEGFTVEVGVGGVPTAVRATFGSGKPVIGFMGEFDALPGLNQKISIHQESDNPGAYGHGCGHNLMCGAHVGAVVGLKQEMIEKNLKGTIQFYACPGEELLTGKGFMARGGAFEDLDVAINFHPNKISEATIGTSTAVNSVKFHFKGRTAHAGGDPHNGRSALDAVELCNVGANYLREHVTSDIRMHYIITEGGTAPNIVPDQASNWYYIRGLSRDAVQSTYERLVKVAEGAAHMTETELTVEFLGGCYNTLNNKVLANVVCDCMNDIPQEPWTAEEIEFARALDEQSPKQYQDMITKYAIEEGTHLYYGKGNVTNFNSFGSTDIGDVMHIVPTAYFFTACTNLGAPGHSWQFASCSGSSIGEKGMIYGAKIMAMYGAKILNNPAIIKEARVEFNAAMKGKKYVCPIPSEVQVP